MPAGEIFEIRRNDQFLSRSRSVLTLPGGRQVQIPIPSYALPSVKNSAGYYAKDGMDLIDIFIGQEGTLSVITEVELGLVKRPEGILSAFVFFDRREDSWAFCDEVRKGGSVDALSIEYFDRNALRLLKTKGEDVPDHADAAIFFEQETARGTEDPVVETWLDIISRHYASADNTWVAMNERDAERFARMRHAVPEAINDIVRRAGFQKLSTDIAVPEDRFREMVDFYHSSLGECRIEHIIFGHIGECHLHVNLLPKSERELARSKETISSFVRKAIALGGTVSAEHGIGKTKHGYLEMMYGRPGLLEMARIKKAFDPNCILGMDNIFPRAVLDEV
jgi:D-lactate dehydrogenase (cytochrome)